MRYEQRICRPFASHLELQLPEVPVALRMSVMRRPVLQFKAYALFQCIHPHAKIIEVLLALQTVVRPHDYVVKVVLRLESRSQLTPRIPNKGIIGLVVRNEVVEPS